MKIKCPACSQVLTIPDSAAGKVVKCPCGKQLRAPAAGPGNPASTPASTSASRPAAGAAGGGGPRRATNPAATARDFDPEMFDELTDQDLKPVKGVTNPYASVSAAPHGAAVGDRELAGVGSRIAGAIVDALFTYLFVGIGVGIAIYVLLQAGEQASSGVTAAAYSAIGVASLIPVVINCVLIAKSGQSVGKKVAGTRMIDQESRTPVGFVQGYLVRTMVFGALCQIPLIGFVIAIVDLVFLFTDQNHQTLHDKLAKTLVVQA